MYTTALLLCFAAQTSTPASDAPPPTTTTTHVLRVAVYDVEGPGIDPRVLRLFTDNVVVELRKLNGVSVVSMEEVRAMLSHEAEKQLLGCKEGASCASEIADALGVDALVVGSLTNADGARAIVMKRIDQVHATTTATFDQRLSGDVDDVGAYFAAIGPAVAKLFDDKPLRDGAARGVKAEVALMVTPPPLPRVATISVAGASIACAVFAGIVGVTALSAQSELQAVYAQSVASPVDAKDATAIHERASSLALGTNVAWLGAGAFAATAVAMAPFTDWLDYAGQRDAL